MQPHKPFKPLDYQGFSLVEVLVSILIITLFIMVGMQAFVSAMSFRTQARRTAISTAWAQENMELIRQRAADTTQIKYSSQPLTAAVAVNATTISVASTDGFRVGDSIVVGNDSVSNRIESLTPTQITLTSQLATPQSVGVLAIPRCRAEQQAAGFAAYLNANLPAVTTDTPSVDPMVGKKNIFGREYTLTRTMEVRDMSPYQLATINLSVIDVSDPTRKVVNMSSEVVPNAFFQCP